MLRGWGLAPLSGVAGVMRSELGKKNNFRLFFGNRKYIFIFAAINYLRN